MRCPILFNKLKKDYFIIATAWSTIYDFTGSRYIYEKKIKQQPRTIFLWVVGIYIALYGIASTRYELSLDRLENRISAVVAQLSTTNKQVFINLVSQIFAVQKEKTPTKPYISNPFSVLTSLYIEERNKSISDWSKDIIEIWKSNLDGIHAFMFSDLKKVNLDGAHLERAVLSGVDFEESELRGAHLEDADLSFSNLKRTDFRNACLERAMLFGVDFEGACLRGANLKKAIVGEDTNFEGVDLREANLEEIFWMPASIGEKFNTLSKVRSPGGLYGVKGLDPEFEKELREKKPALFEDIVEFYIHRRDYILLIE